MHAKSSDISFSTDSRVLLKKLWVRIAPILFDNRHRVGLALGCLLAAKVGLLAIPFLLKALVDGLGSQTSLIGLHWLLALVLAYGG
ncbi:MAG: metal ABC transporter permease, partial [Proteobacteria bacterium]|nr:metal ABC transporter permease [Pseudomonadota bacterium]